MINYRPYDRTTKQPAGHIRVWHDHQEPIDSPKRALKEGLVWVIIQEALIPPHDPSTQQLNKLADLLVESDPVWTLTTNRYEVGPKIETVPAQVTRAQFLVGMLRAGIKDKAEAIIATQDEETRLWYDNALNFIHGNPRIVAINAALGEDAVDLDQFFINASKHAP